MKIIISIVLAALTGCASVHRSTSGRLAADYNGGARGAVEVMEASADISSNEAALQICREQALNQRPCVAYDSRTRRPLVQVGWGVPFGAFGVGGSYLDAAAAIAESRRLLRQNAELRQDVSDLTSDE